MNANYERETRKLRDNGSILVSGLRRNPVRTVGYANARGRKRWYYVASWITGLTD